MDTYLFYLSDDIFNHMDMNIGSIMSSAINWARSTGRSIGNSAGLAINPLNPLSTFVELN